LSGLQDKELIDPIGHTNMNVVEWAISIVMVTEMMQEYRSERPYPQVTVTTPPSQGEDETVIEPEYIPNDENGAPSEHIMTYRSILDVWAEKFPNKRQPLKTNTKLQRKVKARMKVPTFKARFWAALLHAETSPSLQADSWFQLEYLLRNDDNYEKVASGEFDWKDGGRQVEQVTDLPRENVGVISEQNFVPGPNSK
jgi:hypothetical protein